MLVKEVSVVTAEALETVSGNRDSALGDVPAYLVSAPKSAHPESAELEGFSSTAERPA